MYYLDISIVKSDIDRSTKEYNRLIIKMRFLNNF